MSISFAKIKDFLEGIDPHQTGNARAEDYVQCTLALSFPIPTKQAMPSWVFHNPIEQLTN